MDLYLFDRTEKIIHFDDLSILDDSRRIDASCEVVMSENEVFVIQLAVLSDTDDVINSISAKGNADISCINTDVVDKHGVKSMQPVYLKENIIQPLFFTVKAEKLGSRKEKCSVTINTEKTKAAFEIILNINTSPVANGGYDDLWRLSRLNWLNSDLYIDENIVPPYIPPAVMEDKLVILGREIELSSSGLPKQVYSKFDEGIEITDAVRKKLFSRECEFVIGKEALPHGKTEKVVHNNRIECMTDCETERYYAKTALTLRYEGLMEYTVEITPKTDFTVDNASLDFYVSPDCSSLMHGLGHRASQAEHLTFKWDNQKQQDCIFIGSVNCGMRVKFKAENYRRPLINIFYKNLPLHVPAETWDNNGKGKIEVNRENGFTHVSASTGEYSFKENETRKFIFEIHLTPLKPIDYKKAFSVRYCHNNKLKNEIQEIDTAYKNGLTHVIFHQGNMIMPFINYPFFEVDRLRNAVKYAKEKGIGIKLYYTEREHSNHMAETFVYKALGDEIILRKQGISHSWQKEKPQWLIDNFGDDIIPGWFVKYKHGKYKNDHDISFIVRPDTRLDNYYVEGLNWLVDRVGIKGIYIDDTSLDRTTLERAKKVLQKNDGLIDMHMWNHEEVRAGDVSCMNLYTELLPFLDSVWLGEGFFYKKYSPEYMLAEVSGIPYGLTGQMLQDGGDFYLGMLYGMNNRYGWGYTNATQMYALWDSFAIEHSRMLGYWHSENPVKTDNANVLSTVYLKDSEALVCLYNFSDKKESFNIHISEGLLGFVPCNASQLKFGRRRKTKIDLYKCFTLNKRKGIIINIKGIQEVIK